MKITDGGYFFELIFDISNVVGKLQVHLQESTGELDQQRLNAFSARRSPDSPIEHLLLETHTKLTQICASESLSDQIALAAWPAQISWG